MHSAKSFDQLNKAAPSLATLQPPPPSLLTSGPLLFRAMSDADLSHSGAAQAHTAEPQRTPITLVPSPPVAAYSLRILCADDNAINQKVLQKILSRQGHSVTMVDDGEKAVREFEQQQDKNPFDLILLDICMRQSDAHTLARIGDCMGPKSLRSCSQLVLSAATHVAVACSPVCASAAQL